MVFIAVISVLYGCLFWLATLVLVLGIAYRVWQYWRIPVLLPIPTMPAPLTRRGVVWRVAGEVLWFKSLWRADKVLWAWAMLFHWSLWLVLWRHTLFFNALLNDVSQYTIGLQVVGRYAGITLLIGLGGLFARRCLLERVRYISAPSDYLLLLLLIGIAFTGLSMSFIHPVNVVQVKLFFMGLPSFGFLRETYYLPMNPLVWLHLLFVIILMLIFPISKLLHAPAVFFSPTRNQTDYRYNAKQRGAK